MVEISQAGYLGDPGQSLSYEEDTVGLDLLELHFQVERRPEPGVSSQLVESLAHSGYTVQIPVTEIAQNFQQNFRGQNCQAGPSHTDHHRGGFKYLSEESFS